MKTETIRSEDSPFTIRQILLPLIAIIVGMFMVILDGTAMNVALSGLVKDFKTPLSTVQWTVTGYALAQAAVIPLAGWLSDRFGAKKIFLFSVTMFTIGSLLCTLANSIDQLIIFRVLQGLGGGMVAPIAMSFIYRLSPPDKVGSIMGMMGIPILLAPALGPVLSGFLIDYATWHWIFLINLPVGIIAIIIGIRTLPNIERQSVPALDLLGILLAPLAFALLSYGISEGGTNWSSFSTLTGITVGGVALLLFIIVELRKKQPLLELRVFRSANFSWGIIVQWILQIALFGTFFLVPLLLQEIRHYTAFETGLLLLPQAISSAIMMPISGRLSDRLGARPLVIGGLTVVSIATFLLSHFANTDQIAYIILPLILMGMGMGLSMMPLNTHILQAAPRHLVSRVTSLTNSFQQVMNSLAIASLSTLLVSQAKYHLKHGDLTPISASIHSFEDVFFIQSIVALIGVLLAFTLKKPNKQVETNVPKEEMHLGM
ncbi:drug resistance transporter, EmrB/QacA subfamily [Seinonella peptonophila]|uniref:Drug resistance transporter, EmrB/QacA subfamily n=1 Tax=Seinonella peptonophila TaxID=112248 RepID=A0A1M5A7J0_9BACL|nr:MDR family MFS transporter [Seinonella peptonophila]SHF26278.1 drug resistance transporter, EmrB/QacA subfamily [Seinonella peptonophila]